MRQRWRCDLGKKIQRGRAQETSIHGVPPDAADEAAENTLTRDPGRTLNAIPFGHRHGAAVRPL